MPFVRFSRDLRGCDHTFLLDTPSGHGERHPRVLYWHRCPTGLKIGREPFHATIRRELEQAYPNVSFDWAKLTALRPPPPQAPEAEHWRERRRQARARRGAEREDQPQERSDAADQTVLDQVTEPGELGGPETAGLNPPVQGSEGSGSDEGNGTTGNAPSEPSATASAQPGTDPSGRILPGFRRSRRRRRRRPAPG